MSVREMAARIFGGRSPSDLADDELEAIATRQAEHEAALAELARRREAKEAEDLRQAEERAEAERTAEVAKLGAAKKEAEDAFGYLEEQVLNGLADIALIVEKARRAVWVRNDAARKLAALEGKDFASPDAMVLPQVLDVRDPLGVRLRAKFVERCGEPGPERRIGARTLVIPVVIGAGAPDVLAGQGGAVFSPVPPVK